MTAGFPISGALFLLNEPCLRHKSQSDIGILSVEARGAGDLRLTKFFWLLGVVRVFVFVKRVHALFGKRRDFLN